ncbi:unnamed protein product [Prorocentrum cordatum]|uniref:Protein YIPF3 n=1 Tax=Prorocentrum cordatum TaxID=2364126 RepID=A0ABN9YBP8_9DINO|nr:unnamed protein product [Polarella glacialis]
MEPSSDLRYRGTDADSNPVRQDESAIASVRDVPNFSPVEVDIGAMWSALKDVNVSEWHVDQIRRRLEECNVVVPRFLLDKNHPHHLPPHAAVIDLLLHNARLDQSSVCARRPGLGLELWLWTPFAMVGSLVQLLLEVFGGVGAVWGCAEVLNLREGLHPAWQVTSLVVGIICFARFCVLHASLSTDRSFLQEHPRFVRLPGLSKLQAVCRSPFQFLFHYHH